MPFFVVRVAVPVPLRRLFDYLPVATDGRDQYRAGQRVRISFGKQLLTGIVITTADSSDVPEKKLRPLLERLDNEPILDAELLVFGQWLGRYYHHNPGELYDLMLPAMLRRGGSLLEAHERLWQIRPADTTSGSEPAQPHPEQPEPVLKGPRQQALWEKFRQQPAWPHSDLTADGFTLAQLRALAERGLINETSAVPLPPTGCGSQTALALNDQQQQCVTRIAEELDSFNVWLIEGITGSGKTEVYLQLMAQVLQAGKQVMVLVPEIGLTPQTVQRFRHRFAEPVVLLHSGLNDRERLQAWSLCRSGQARILIGTRSAIFTPLPQLGLIILDEEHDSSFKQQDGVRYSARDAALVRARKRHIPVILGSATPSLESLHNALTGRYRHLRLTRRAGHSRPPGMKLHSILHQPLSAGFAQPVIATMQKHLERGQQVLVFLNRRGFAPLFACPDCGWMAECRRCDSRLTLHQSPPRLHCHHCDFQQGIPGFCPSCHSDRVQALGQGTERIHDSLSLMFPDVPLTRIDRDTARTKLAFDELLAEIHQPGPRLLVGTQMLAKGHHFPGVTMVVVLDADAGLFSADFRGMEHTAQLILQVAGRAGREETPGEVWIQTLYADHPLLNLLIDNGYHALALSLLQQRQQQQLPPYSHMVMLRAEAAERQLAEQLLQQARQFLQHPQQHWNLQHNNPLLASPLVLLGPVPAIMERRAGRFRQQLQLYSPDRSRLHSALDPLVDYLHSLKGMNRVRWHLDVDPIDSI